MAKNNRKYPLTDKRRSTQPSAARLSCAGLVTTLVASMVTIAVQARQPRLVVGIMVDGLNQEYVDRLRSHFGPDGFNRFMRQGIVLENVDYGTSLDPTAATAVIMTGASPSVNGIAGALHYDPTAKRHTPSLNDPAAIGNYTDETYSPRALRVTTLSDESRIAGAGVTYAYSIAPDPVQAIIMAGHSGNSAAWLNERTGNWASTTYYGDMPTPLTQRNRMTPLDKRLETMVWEPSQATSQYGELPYHLTRYPFHYTFQRGNQDRIAAFKASPLINTEITQLATDYINALQLGAHDGTDMLNVAYTLQPYPFSKTAENRYELTDSYIKLDAELAKLLSTIDQRVGADGAIVFVAATPPSSRRRRDDQRWNIPTGEFSTLKAASLLNLYLMAIHGNGEWVKAINGRHVYLNDELAKARNVDIAGLRRQSAAYLKRMAGVDRATSVDDVLSGSTGYDNGEALRRNTLISASGDVLIDLKPGWELVDDYNDRSAASHTKMVTVNALTTAPVYMLIPETEPQTIKRVVDARVIAPTVAGQMHIRPPNGAALPPLRFSESEHER